MVTVSERAKARLLEQKHAPNLDGEADGLRVAAGPSGQWILVADQAREDDQIVEYMGSTVLLIDPVAQSALDGVRMDCLETAEGDPELVLVALDGKTASPIWTQTRRESFENTVIRNEGGRAVTSQLTVGARMTPDPIALPQTASIFDAAQKMRDASIGNVVVLDGQKVCGIVTDRDIVVRALATGRDARSTRLAAICSRELTTLSPEDSVETAVRLMRQHAVRRLPVVKGDRPVGILTLGDLAIEEDGESALADVSGAAQRVADVALPARVVTRRLAAGTAVCG